MRTRSAAIQQRRRIARMGLALAIATSLLAQPSPDGQDLSLAQAVQLAIGNYPSVRVSQEEIDAAAAGIELARTAYLPRIDALAQVNRATRNNIFGMVLPQSVIPSISGPPLNSNNFGTVWGSAAGLLVSWEPFDFGLRNANVAITEASRARSEAALRRTEFEVAVAAADAYLTLAAAQETVQAAQASVDRAEVVLETTSALADAQLRPGADASRAEAELAAARTQLIQAEQAVDVARATLAQFTGLEPSQLSISAPRLSELPPADPASALDVSLSPITLEQNSVIAQTQAQLRALERSYFPRFSAQAAAYARGTGAENDGGRMGGFNGLAPNFQNYAVGLTVTFPLFELPSIRARQAERSAAIRAETARYDKLVTDLRAQWNRAVAGLNGSRRVAENTPIQVSSAQTTLEQMTARYQAELDTIDEVANAQRLLTQAEIEDALARLSVWRSLLSVAAAAGDIQPFVAEASQ